MGKPDAQAGHCTRRRSRPTRVATPRAVRRLSAFALPRSEVVVRYRVEDHVWKSTTACASARSSDQLRARATYPLLRIDRSRATAPRFAGSPRAPKHDAGFPIRSDLRAEALLEVEKCQSLGAPPERSQGCASL